ncbi:uncharacterized protein L969DRAFT_44736 [Mixia osmundae IAM 14324]|uniref:DNA polymerase alpha/delta/epsilon subunit B domain-containing protein n=1 Tax=Mixia osmundae (strain CBS 9802 / IAM 14324 / JCM 22182 / KY 12970) TaxID=764103 RepID=G7DTP6_MIXOS|nr:uncharacterized protein L969DRAFT_44736 [Mixia osmundae IAM 14324]KEI41670.1 hypothetical protein L969DRAFT_44736 [Mixia osmundae IAM 14324]GAA93956.1 hypothetical protein E5Q_00602 [Mixia osmundae IAM 14324]
MAVAPRPISVDATPVMDELTELMRSPEASTSKAHASEERYERLVRHTTAATDSALEPLNSALLLPIKKTYGQQYANIYFIRLTQLVPRVLARARRRWLLESPGNSPRAKKSKIKSDAEDSQFNRFTTELLLHQNGNSDYGTQSSTTRGKQDSRTLQEDAEMDGLEQDESPEPDYEEDVKPRMNRRNGAKKQNGSGARSTSKIVNRVLEVQRDELCIVAGTIYVEMKLKPSVLDEIAIDYSIPAAPPRKYVTPGVDEVLLEDSSGRIRLIGTGIEQGKWALVTGIIVSVLGAETATGDFEVLDLIFPGPPPQLALGLPEASPEAAMGDSIKDEQSSQAPGQWVAITSGLNFGDSSAPADAKRALLSEWLTGELGNEQDRLLATRVSRLIVAGNSMMVAPPKHEEPEARKAKKYGYDAAVFSPKPTADMDAFLEDLLPSIDVDLMPGENDPSAPTMPQQPLIETLLPKAQSLGGCAMRSNPCWIDSGGAILFGTSGQNLNDIYKYISSDDRLTMAANTIEWSHIAPTSPDTLWTYPFSERDPFILPKTPHIYFVGNQPAFETCLITTDDEQKIRVVLVPAFSDKAEIALINTATLECQSMRFA